MLRSENRILTTHAGSLPRRENLTAMLVKSSRGEDVDRAAMLREIEESTRYVVQKQLEAGIDVGNNGEQSRESFFTHVLHRMSGFGGRSERPIMRDLVRYASFRKLIAPLFQR
jgi:5-methyltetrahydropteroyltriglutamate--homocysteine methyltransferase